MEIDVHCFNCTKQWKSEVETTHPTMTIVGFEFCSVCRKKMMANFEMQFAKVLLLPRIRLEKP
jgi:hypothetical protein